MSRPLTFVLAAVAALAAAACAEPTAPAARTAPPALHDDAPPDTTCRGLIGSGTRC